MEASKTWDVETLVSLWTDDIVSIPQGGQPIIGKEANRNSLLKLREASRDVDIVEYDLAFNEVKVIGDWAFEWGTFSGTIRSKDGGEPSKSSGNLFRVLKRDADGSWKIARTMYNDDSATESEPESSE
jgi:ketosteroid isomerase-like protein